MPSSHLAHTVDSSIAAASEDVWDSPRSANSTPSTIEHPSTELPGNKEPTGNSPLGSRLSHGKRRSRSRKLIPSVEGDKVIANRFRTKLCRNYLQHPDRPCPYEDRCMFAHGGHELRTAAQNIAEGLISEEAIREFKRRLHQTAVAIAPTPGGTSSPARAGKPKKASFSSTGTLASAPWSSPASAFAILQGPENESSNSPLGRLHQWTGLQPPPPPARGELLNSLPHNEGSDVHIMQLQPFGHPAQADRKESPFQRQPLLRDPQSGSMSTATHTYIHNPYAWRAI